MLRIVFFGMETGILDKLKHCHVHLAGAYLPPGPYWIRKKWLLLSNFPWVIKKLFKTVAVYSVLYDFLKANNIPALKTADINSYGFREKLGRLQPDLGIVANFGQIIGASLLAIPKYGFINMHPSLLPRYRGPDPFGHTLLNGEKISGVTWHQMTTRIDQGNILAQDSFPVGAHDTIKALETKAVALAKKLMEPLLQQIEQGTVKSIPQNEADATYFPRLTTKEKEQLNAMRTG